MRRRLCLTGCGQVFSSRARWCESGGWPVVYSAHFNPGDSSSSGYSCEFNLTIITIVGQSVLKLSNLVEPQI